MDINQFIATMGNLGFVVIIAVYLLLRLEKKIISLTQKINDLNKKLNGK